MSYSLATFGPEQGHDSSAAQKYNSDLYTLGSDHQTNDQPDLKACGNTLNSKGKSAPSRMNDTAVSNQMDMDQ
ncbi:hypothetical protein MJO29_001115 [Puccinia striiformis f. sp. tritici]|nr:hypothetical protein MJO29_001115 [Puccinia striiformis f. sp. tritici]